MSRSGMSSANVSVHLRVRGFDNPDPQRQLVKYKVDPSKRNIRWTSPKETGVDDTERRFNFDHIFDMGADQSVISKALVRPMVDNIWDGFNSCCFAYGQTGSGKTYSIFGEAKGPRRGIVPRVLSEVFEVIEQKRGQNKTLVLVSFLELYLDQIRDLGLFYVQKQGKSQMSVPPSERNLDIRQDENGTVYVRDLERVEISSVEEGLKFVQMGLQERQTHETVYNKVSSRSHTVLTITLVRTDNASGDVLSGTLNLVDLAGSERLSDLTEDSQRIRETKSINSSLSSLGKVVMSLNSGSFRHIPYRDSKLTRLLQNTLGGNSFCALLATVNPATMSYEESLNTMQFANRCKNVLNKIHVNYIGEDAATLQKKVRKLLDQTSDLTVELSRLKIENRQLQVRLSQFTGEAVPEIDDPSAGPAGAMSPVSAGAGAAAGAAGGAASPARGAGLPGLGAGGMGGPRSIERQSKRASKGGKRKNETEQLKEKIATIEKKLREANAERERLEKRAMENEKKHLEQSNKFRKMIAQRDTELKEGLQAKEALRVRLEADKEKTVKKLVEESNLLIAKQRKEFKRVRAVYGFDAPPKDGMITPAEAKEKEVEERKTSERIKEAVAAERVRMAKHSEDKIRSLKDQFDAFARTKNRDMRRFVAEYTTYRESKKKQLADLRKEVQYLYEYITMTTGIIQSMETGKYAITQKSGIKGYKIPAALRGKMSLAPERCTQLAKEIRKARKFMKRNNIRETESDLFTGTETKGISSDMLMATQRMEAERKKLLDELASDKTVMYIKRLEDERDHYHRQLLESTKTQNSMRVSLKAANRLLARVQSPKAKLRGGPRSPSATGDWGYSMNKQYSTLGSPMALSKSELQYKQRGKTERLYSSPISGSAAMRPTSSYGLKSRTGFAPTLHSQNISRATTSYSRSRGGVGSRPRTRRSGPSSPQRARQFGFSTGGPVDPEDLSHTYY